MPDFTAKYNNTIGPQKTTNRQRGLAVLSPRGVGSLGYTVIGSIKISRMAEFNGDRTGQDRASAR